MRVAASVADDLVQSAQKKLNATAAIGNMRLSRTGSLLARCVLLHRTPVDSLAPLTVAVWGGALSVRVNRERQAI